MSLNSTLRPGGTAGSLRLRIALTLAAILTIDLLFVAGVAWGGHGLLSLVTAPRAPSAPVVASGLLLAGVALAVIQARLGYRRSLDRLDARPANDGDLRERVEKLALAAGIPVPDVAIVDEPRPNSFSVGNGTEATVVVTTGLLETLDEAEIQAVLAHEVAHLANRDTTVATMVATFSALSDTLFRRERKLADWLRFLVFLSMFSLVFLVTALPIAIGLVVYLAISLVSRTVLAANAICAALHARTREYAADRAAARLTGNPAALAAALEKLHENPPERDARVTPAASLGIVAQPIREPQADFDPESLLERWFPSTYTSDGGFLSPDSTLSRGLARLGRALEWRPRTHPPIEDRIRRLEAIEAEQEST